MGVEPVKYTEVSASGEGFAKAGDSVSITTGNAETVYKDVTLGKTQKLSKGQTQFLDSIVDPDNIQYDSGESKKVGENMIDTEGKDGEDLSEKNGKGGMTATTIATGAGVLLFALSTQVGINAIKLIAPKFDGFGQLASGIIAAAAGVGACVSSFLFDPNKNERKAQTSEAGSNIGTINDFKAQIDTDIENSAADIGKYNELVAQQTQDELNFVTESGRLKSEIAIFSRQGLNPSSQRAELSSLKEDLESNGNKEQIDAIKQNLEDCNNRISQANGVKNSGDTVAEFLRDGYNMKTWADINKYALLACAAACAVTAACILPKWIIDVSGNTAAKVLFYVAAAAFLVASNNMRDISNTIEHPAGEKGSEMASALGDLQESTNGGESISEEADSTYNELDAKMAKAIGDAQKNTTSDRGAIRDFVPNKPKETVEA